MEKHLSYNMQSAEFQSGEMFQLTPYKIGYGNDCFACTITPLKDEPTPTKHRSCLVRVVDALREEIKALNFPGSIGIRFIQQNSTDWITVFASNRKLVSAYMKLTDSDVRQMIARSFDE